jgi:PDDEXK-like domain of unknown function (DUF3799)
MVKKTRVNRLQKLGSILAVHEDDHPYHSRTEISKHDLDQIAKSPAHYMAHKADLLQKDTPDTIMGNALHTKVLEPSLFVVKYVLMPKFSGKGKKKQKDDFLTSLRPGQFPIPAKKKHWDIVAAMAAAIDAQPQAGNF